MSYVPQVARDLQTAPVVPPGAFPNGQGTGEQYGSEIPGRYVSFSTQESAATLAEWTAKQEQLKREAEELILQEVDPEGIPTGKRAIKVAEALEKEADNIRIDLTNGVGELPGVTDETETLFTRALEWGEENDLQLAEGLRRCGSKTGKGKWVTYGSGIFAEKFWQSAVCCYDFNYKELFGRFIVEKNPFVEMCWDNPNVGDEAWSCPHHGVWHFN